MIAWLLALIALSQQVTRDSPIPHTDQGATIRGVAISDDSSRRPVRHALVTLTSSGLAKAETLTGDDGVFTFREVVAGRYELTAEKPGFAPATFGARPGRDVGTPIAIAPGQQLTTLELRIPRGAVITGTVTGPNGEPLSSVDVTAFYDIPQRNGTHRINPLFSARTNDEGVYRLYGLSDGEFVVMANLAPATDTPIRYPPTLYPGVTNTSEAIKVSVRSGDERSGIDIAMRPSPTAFLSGLLLSKDGRPVSGEQVTLTVADGAPRTVGSDFSPMMTRTDGEGAFVFANVRSGTYLVAVEQFIGKDASPSQPALPAQWAQAEVFVNGRDVEGVTLTLRSATPVAGRVILDGSTGSEPPMFSWGGVRSSTSTRMHSDGTIGLNGLIPGRYSLNLTTQTGTAIWQMTSVAIGGVAIDPAAIDVGSVPITNLTVTLTDKLGGVRGALTAASGAPVFDFLVAVFSADRSSWARPSDVHRVVAPDTNGAWELKGLPPGEYRVAALADWMSNSQLTPELLEQLLPASAPVVVTANSTATINLRIGG